MNPRKNLVGRQFGRLTVIAFSGKNTFHNTKWMCLCECGGIRDNVLYQSLISGRTVSCGCAPRGDGPREPKPPRRKKKPTPPPESPSVEWG